MVEKSAGMVGSAVSGKIIITIFHFYFSLLKGHIPDQYRLACTIKLYTDNIIVTDNIELCSESEKWINDLILKSTLISGTSVKERFRFFQTSKNKIENLIDKIKL
jgi:hypothetical protein